MIDFVRIQYKDALGINAFIADKENFDKVTSRVDARSGEVENTYRTKLKSMDLTISESHANIKNSLHKFHNLLEDDTNQNYNDFSYTKLCETIDYITSRLKGIKDGYITQLEFGINIETPTPAKDILRNNVLMHQFKCFNSNNQYRGKGEYREFTHSNYSVKIYDKAKQYKLAKNILRVEIKFTRRKEFNQLDIWTIDDLKSKSKLINLFKYLIKRFDELIILDAIEDIRVISEKDKTDLIQYSNYLYWQRMSEHSKRYHKSKNIEKFKHLVRKYNLDKTKRLIKRALINKVKDLLNS